MSLKTIDNILTLSVELEDAFAIRQLQPIEQRVKPELFAIIQKAAETPAVCSVAVEGKGLASEGGDGQEALGALVQ